MNAYSQDLRYRALKLYLTGNYTKVLSLLLKHWGLEPGLSLLLVVITMGSKEFIASMEYDGYTNTEVFLSWVEHCYMQGIKTQSSCDYR